MAKFEIVMIGNKSVGKTSMLSALSKELDKFNLTNSLKLEPTTVEFKILRDKWNEMVELVENQTAFSSLEAAIEGTAVDFVDHKFNFIADGSTKADVVFVDTKGTLTGDLIVLDILRSNMIYYPHGRKNQNSRQGDAPQGCHPCDPKHSIAA